MDLREISKYLLLVCVVAAIAFTLEVISADIGVELSTKTILNTEGKSISTLQVVYPLWHQLLRLVTNFLYGLAAAIFITVFVANRLQKAQQDKKQDELKKLSESININIFDSLFKTIIPEEIFKIIKQEIIENKVLRREAKWIYDFSIQENKVFSRVTTRYELHNMSQEKVVDPIKLELDTLGGNDYTVNSAECIDKYGNILVKYDAKDSSNNKNTKIEQTGSKTIIEYAVEIPPCTHIEYKTIVERHYDGNVVDSQATKVPVIGAELIVNFPAGYTFEISPTMSTKPKLINESNVQKIYKIDGGILPWQGFSFYLVKSKS